MLTVALSDETLLECVQLYEQHERSITKAAAAIGMSRTTFQDRIKVAAKRGLLGFKSILPGFEIARSTEHLPDGSWVRQIPAAENEFELPAGHIIKGISSLVDQDGKEKMKWIKTRTEDVTPTLVAALEQRFMSMEPRPV